MKRYKAAASALLSPEQRMRQIIWMAEIVSHDTPCLPSHKRQGTLNLHIYNQRFVTRFDTEHIDLCLFIAFQNTS